MSSYRRRRQCQADRGLHAADNDGRAGLQSGPHGPGNAPVVCLATQAHRRPHISAVPVQMWTHRRGRSRMRLLRFAHTGAQRMRGKRRGVEGRVFGARYRGDALDRQKWASATDERPWGMYRNSAGRVACQQRMVTQLTAACAYSWPPVFRHDMHVQVCVRVRACGRGRDLGMDLGGACEVCGWCVCVWEGGGRLPAAAAAAVAPAAAAGA